MIKFMMFENNQALRMVFSFGNFRYFNFLISKVETPYQHATSFFMA